MAGHVIDMFDLPVIFFQPGNHLQGNLFIIVVCCFGKNAFRFSIWSLLLGFMFIFSYACHSLHLFMHLLAQTFTVFTSASFAVAAFSFSLYSSLHFYAMPKGALPKAFFIGLFFLRVSTRHLLRCNCANAGATSMREERASTD